MTCEKPIKDIFAKLLGWLPGHSTTLYYRLQATANYENTAAS